MREARQAPHTLIAVVALGVTAACSLPEEPGTVPAGEACGETAACAAELYCSADRVCREAGTVSAGQACQGPEDCQRGLICVVSRGRSECIDDGGGAPGAACTSFVDCRAGLFCAGGACSTSPDGPGRDGGGGSVGEGEECTLTAECAANLYCAPGRTCERAGFRQVGQPCPATSACRAGLVCDPDGLCAQPEDGEPGTECTDITACQAGLLCVEGLCAASPDGFTMLDGGALDAGQTDGGAGGMACESRAECDDGDGCTIDLCVNNSCVSELQDADLDGYASDRACGAGRDCNDMNDDVNPDHTTFHDTPHSGGGTGVDSQSFDWNCDGTIEGDRPRVVLSCSPDTGCAGEGWIGGVPECGASGDFGRCGDGCTIEVTASGVPLRCR
jgi:hypothetical protein